MAAIRYFMLKFTRNSVIAFDFAEALSFEGESGPYIQYAVVRANNIFNKLKEREGLSPVDVIRALEVVPPDELAYDGDGECDRRRDDHVYGERGRSGDGQPGVECLKRGDPRPAGLDAVGDLVEDPRPRPCACALPFGCPSRA